MSSVPSGLEDTIVERPFIAQLATSVDRQPRGAPVWYQCEDDIIRFTPAGEKMPSARRNHRVAVSIRDDDAGHPEGMVMVQGPPRVIEDVAGNTSGTRAVYKRPIGPETEEWAPYWHQQSTDPDDGRFVIEMEVDSAGWKRY